ncbi:MAG: (deoxy)nucleoside triphosphate pyrophosphohydrolase [Pirellulaceae bacterium]|jgi:8-oxo-dGTP diphosphatase|nr:(deoxy)nucleoside triphosphate pyrophosphohydrolase [Pirellulaceae bacterium]
MVECTSVAVAVVQHAGCFLVGQRPSDQPLGGLWEFPGGKVQEHESPHAAAARECHEETGLRVVVTQRLMVHQQAYPHGMIRLHFFACRPAHGACEPRAPFRWVPRDELARLDFPAGNRPLLDYLLQ